MCLNIHHSITSLGNEHDSSSCVYSQSVASGFSLEPRLCVKTETVITYPSLYPHIYGRGNSYLSEKQALYLLNFSHELVDFRPVYTGGGSRGFEQTPFWLNSGFCRTRRHTKKHILIETSLHHKLCSTMSVSS